MKKLFWLSMGLVACEADPTQYDADLDGTPDYDDCEPTNAEIGPLADETCDGIDNNCNGLIDEGLIETWYLDEDQDGYAGFTNAVIDCVRPEGARLTPTDCDDTRPRVNPNGTEVCDGLDNDCDNEIDEAFWVESFDSESGYDAFNLQGAARTDFDFSNNGYLALTPEESQSRGAIWLEQRVKSSNWNMSFDMQFGSSTQGEGITIAWHRGDSYRVLGPSGPDLAIFGETVPGYAIEFDNHFNEQRGDQATTPHVALRVIESGQTRAINDSPPEFADASWHRVNVEMYNNFVTVTIDGNEALAHDMGRDFSDTYIGFTASTSGLVASSHSLDNVSLTCPRRAVAPPPAEPMDDTGM